MIALRPVTAADRPFLLGLYRSTREAELDLTSWSDTAKAAFVGQQFAEQDAHYRAHHPDASFDVIEVDGAPAGRLYVDRSPHAIHVMDITLAPGFRGRGIGTRLLTELLAEAGRRPVSAHVARDSPALSLLVRLGFAEAGDHGAQVLMQRR